MTSLRTETRIGVLMGAAAYTLWGVLPLYIRLLRPVTPPGILAHRILWSVVILALLAFALKRWGPALAAIRQPRVALALCGSTVAIGCNWLLYIYAINSDHAVQASLGYFINPLVNVVLGVAVLRERLGRAETIAVLFASAGVALLTVEQGSIPYIPLGLALTFGIYGLIRKMIGLGPVEGMLVETALLAPFALLWLATQPILPAGETAPAYGLLMFAGVVTTAPLLLFSGAANRIRYSTLGLLQYIGPTLQLTIAVLAFGEPVLPIYVPTFGLIWTGLAIYVFATWRRGRVTPAAPE